MSNWDERADNLSRDWDAEQARILETAAKAKAEEEARSRAAYDKLADLVRWAIRRYQVANIQPTPIYIRWEENVRVSRRETRLEVHETRIGEAYKLNYWERPADYEHFARTYLLLVTPDGQIMETDDTEPCLQPSEDMGPSYRESRSIYKVYDRRIVIWSSTPPTNNLLDYLRLVDIKWAQAHLTDPYRADHFYDGAVAFVGEETRGQINSRLMS